MSTFNMVFVGMVITAMAALMAALGWACWYTRDTPPGPSADVTAKNAHPEDQDRLAA